MAETGVVVGADELAALKHLALAGALEGRAKLSTTALAGRLDASKQTASRRLQGLEDEGYVERELQSDGQLVAITRAGERALRREYEQYRRVFEEEIDAMLTGRVTSGMGEGRHYISLPGYMRQFRDLLGYEPFAGTLNVDLEEESVRERARLEAFEPIFVEGWEDDERTYGPVFCWPASVEAGETYEPAHVIAPERTHHGKDQLELVAPARLRDELDLEDGDEITIHVTEH